MSPISWRARPSMSTAEAYERPQRSRIFAALLLLPLLCVTLPVVQPDPRRALAREGIDAPPTLLARYRIDAPGAVRISAKALAALGIEDPTRVHARRANRPVASRADGKDFVFLAAHPAGRTARWGVYELVDEAPPAATAKFVRAAPLEDTEADSPRQAPWTAVQTVDTDHFHGDLAAGPAAVYAHPKVPTWFLAGIDPQGSAKIAIPDLALPAAAGPGTLRLHVFATHMGPVQFRAILRGHGLGAARVEQAHRGATLSWTVPAEALAGSGALELEDESPPLRARAKDDVTHAYGRTWIDRIDVSYLGADKPPSPVRLTRVLARSGTPLPQAPGRAGHAFLLSAGGTPLGASAWQDATRLALDLPPPPGATLVLAPSDRAAPTPLPRVELKWPELEGVAHLILATPPLVAEARRLAAHRRAHGLPSAVVSSDLVWDRYGFGEISSAAIRRFLDGLPTPETLRYVLLVGDATLDRADLVETPVLPTPLARTKFNGATSSDRLYVRPASGDKGGPSIGRLPFRSPSVLRAFVDRLIAYETAPPIDASRHRLRFMASEGRFGAQIDSLLESTFRRVLAKHIPPAFDVEVTFASLKSPYLWPPASLSQKVIDDINDGALFMTYVGHGFEKGFDTLRVGNRRFPIFSLKDVEQVETRGLPPVVMVVACTTAMFDGVRGPGVDEALLARPKGPIACWGATRICHPAANALLGLELGAALGAARPGTRLGDLLDSARDSALSGGRGIYATGAKLLMVLMRMQGYDIDQQRLMAEASWMYTLLGDPATALALPKPDVRLGVAAALDGDVHVDVAVEAPDGAQVLLRRMRHRNDPPPPEPLPGPPLDPSLDAALRARHARMNDMTLAWTEGTIQDGRVALTLEGPAQAGEVVQAIVRTDSEIWHGARVLNETDFR